VSPPRGLAARLTVGRTVLLGLALGGGVLAATAPAWVRATTSTAVAAQVPLAVSGAQAAPGVGAGGLVVLAAAGALALGGPAIRWTALAGTALGGLLVVVFAFDALSGVQAAALAQARALTGVAVLDGQALGTALPWVAAMLGAATVALAIGAGVAARSWPAPGTRHERPSVAEEVSLWDAADPDEPSPTRSR